MKQFCCRILIVLFFSVILVTSCDSNTPASNTIAVCGNGIIETAEQCDDGNLENGDGCQNTCLSASLCDPLIPAGVCASGWRCLPEQDAVPRCVLPTASGPGGGSCSTKPECLSTELCLSTNTCAPMCVVGGAVTCPALTSCTGLSTPRFVGVVEYGVCI